MARMAPRSSLGHAARRFATRSLFAVLVTSALGLASGCADKITRYRLNGGVPSPSRVVDFDAAVFETLGARMRGGHTWKILDDGKVFDALVEEIGRAKHSVNLVTYIWQPGEPSGRLLEALEKRDRKVVCRVVVDPVGSPDFAAEVEPRLAKAGCLPRYFRPFLKKPTPQRNHRKIVVVDGELAFVGGFGIRKEWVRGSGSSDPEWRDINFMVRGPVVADLQRGFAQNWVESGGELLGADEFPLLAAEGGVPAVAILSTAGVATDAERVTHLTIASAEKRLWIWNAYFSPGDAILDLLIAKRKAGVDVRLLFPGDKNDVPVMKVAQRATYDKLLAAGIAIYEFTPTMMHAKTTIVDDRLALIGSINFEDLSLTMLEESAVLVLDTSLVQALEADWQKDMTHARQVTPTAKR